VRTESTTADKLWPRIRDTFVAPGRLARQLRVDAPWIDVLLISTAIAVVSVLGMPDEVFIESMREAVTRRGEPVEITSPPEEVARWGRAIAMLATLATHPMIAFTLAGILTLVFSIAGGGRGTYREYLSLASHALLIPALGTLVALVIRLATGFAFEGGPIGAFLRPDDAGSMALAVIAALDPFILWMMVAVGVGVHEIEERRSRARYVIVLLAAYLLLVLASTYLLNPHLR
jgi:hypothetical protein